MNSTSIPPPPLHPLHHLQLCPDVQETFSTYFSLYTIVKKKPKKKPAFLDGLGNFVFRSPRSRIIRVHPAPFNSETFHARLLLLQGSCLATSWPDLQTVDGVILPTFGAAAQARGLLLDHRTAEITPQDALASELTTPCRARVLLLAVRLLLLSSPIYNHSFPLSAFSHPPVPSRSSRTSNATLAPSSTAFSFLCWTPTACTSHLLSSVQQF